LKNRKEKEEYKILQQRRKITRKNLGFMMQGEPNQNYFRFYFLNLKLFFFLNLVFNVEGFMGFNCSLIRYFHIDVTQKPYLTSALVIVKEYNLNKKSII